MTLRHVFLKKYMKNELYTEFLTPIRIVDYCGNFSNINTLKQQKSMQICLQENDVCTITGKGYIILDFGKEYAGGIRVFTYHVSQPTCNVRIRFGESLTESCSSIGKKGACNDHSLRDFTTMLTSFSDMTFGQTGFRFVRIDFLEDVTVVVKNIYCAYTHRKFPTPKPFFTKDDKIDLIYKTAKHTIELCCQNYLWDGIKRDRLVWMGDTHPEMLALTSLYGKYKVLENSIEFSLSEFSPDEWMNKMPMYSVWTLIILSDYYTFNSSFVEKYKTYIYNCFSYVSTFIKGNGQLAFPSYFIDWATHEQVDELAGCRALLIVMANKCKKLFELLNLKTDIVDETKNKLLLAPIVIKKSKQALALKFWATGELSQKEILLLVNGGAKGMSTFMSYYILKAVVQTFSKEKAIEMMKEYYGAMLDKGATSFFEDFDIDWVDNSCRIDELPKERQLDIHGDFGKYCYNGFRHSLCHGWSSGVIQFIYEYCNEY